MGIGNWIQAQVTVKDAVAKAMVLTEPEKAAYQGRGRPGPPRGPRRCSPRTGSSVCLGMRCPRPSNSSYPIPHWPANLSCRYPNTEQGRAGFSQLLGTSCAFGSHESVPRGKENTELLSNTSQRPGRGTGTVSAHAALSGLFHLVVLQLSLVATTVLSVH